MRRIAGGLVVVSAAVAIGVRIPATAQGSGLAAARVSHIGVIVPDMDVALRHYARVMGFPMAKANTVAVPMPDGRKAEIRLATLYMPNFYIELTQPVNAIGPYHDHQQAQGMSIQHIGLVVPGPDGVDDVRGALEQQGGRWTLGAKGAPFAFINFQPPLGTNYASALKVVAWRTKRAAAGTCSSASPCSTSGPAKPASRSSCTYSA